MTRPNRVGLSLGGAFAALVVALLVGLHASPVRVDHPARWSSPPQVLICDSAPAWVLGEVQSVAGVLAAHGLVLGPVGRSRCAGTCAYSGRLLACVEGAIAIDLRDAAFSDDHAGETLIAADGARLTHATVLLPETIASDTATLPIDARRLVLAHELTHALGYGHSYTSLANGVVGHKTGELMNPSILAGGWGFAGLP